MSEETNKEISTTQRWGIGIIISIFIASSTFLIKLGNIEQQITQNTADIHKNEERIDNLNDDIREILLGIEQVKARLGIVESTDR